MNAEAIENDIIITFKSFMVKRISFVALCLSARKMYFCVLLCVLWTIIRI